MSQFAPRLWKTHPNFFIIFLVTAFLHLSMWYLQLWSPDRYDEGSFVKMFELAPMPVWAWGSFLVWVLMTFGVYYKFHVYARVGLALGFFLCLARGLLLELSTDAGTGIFLWGTVAALHFAQMSEPTINPLTLKE